MQNTQAQLAQRGETCSQAAMPYPILQALGFTLSFLLAGSVVASESDEWPIMVVCDNATWLEGQPFNADTQAEGHADWPESAAELDANRYRDPAFRSIPRPEGYLVIQEYDGSLRGELLAVQDRVAIDLRIEGTPSDGLSWVRLQARYDDEEYLGVFTDDVYWRPASNLVASPLANDAISIFLDEAGTLHFQGDDISNGLRLHTGPILAGFEQAEMLCFQGSDEPEGDEDTD